MNYFSIRNKYEIVKYEYLDIFDIQIYYINKNSFSINIKRIDSIEGWGLLLQIKLYDIYDSTLYQLLTIGNSNENIKNILFETHINLEEDTVENSNVPFYISPRNNYLLKNDYNIYKTHNHLDINLVLYYVTDYECQIIIRRIDEEYGWDTEINISIDDFINKNIKQYIIIPASNLNYYINTFETKIKLVKYENDYQQNIPKIIFQTGRDKYFKNMYHYNSIMSFIDLNPEYTYIYYNNIHSRKFLKNNYNDKINYIYDLLVPGAYKADLLRYCFLYNYGGCYFDCKQILRIPIRYFLDPSKDIVLCNDVIPNAFLNAVIFTIKNNKLFDKVIKDCLHTITNNLCESALELTGPIFFYKSIISKINTNDILLQNFRPPNDFNDFTKDYINNNIKLIKFNNIILNRFYKNYYVNYIDNEHYGKLFDNNEIYYINVHNFPDYKVSVYPHKNKIEIAFKLINKKLYIRNLNSKNGWNFELKIYVINNHTLDEEHIYIGIYNQEIKEIDLE
jgi:hypothetical protein